MKRALAVLTFPLLFAAAGPARSADLQTELKAMVDSELAFARMAEEKTVRDAFLTFSAENGVLMGPNGAANARQQIASRPAPPPDAPKVRLLWWPVYADISRSGDMGWTTGPSKRMRGDQTGYGNFVTVWKKQPDGTWRWLMDHGINNKEMSPLGPDTPIPPVRAEKLKGEAPKVDVAAVKEELLAVDRELSKVTAKGDTAGWIAAMADNARVMRDGPQPAVGKEAVAAALSKEQPVTTEALGGEVSSAGDLGFTYGWAEWKSGKTAKKGSYMRIWEKLDGKWKLVMDNTNPFPPPPPAPAPAPAPTPSPQQ